jgi:hypothetical protein
MVNFISGIEIQVLLPVECSELAQVKVGYSKIRRGVQIVNLYVIQAYFPTFFYFFLSLFFNFNFVEWGVESRSTRHCGHLMAYCVSPG